MRKFDDFFPVDYLCSHDANVYDIDFIRFQIRDMDSGVVLFEVAKPPGYDPQLHQAAGDNADPDAGRFVRYHFSPSFLKLRSVGAALVFVENIFLEFVSGFLNDINLLSFLLIRVQFQFGI